MREHMTSEVASILCGGDGPHLPDMVLDTPDNPAHCGIAVYDNRYNLVSPCEAYQSLLMKCDSDVQILFHEDVTVHDPTWRDSIMEVFRLHPDAVAVGLGGATQLGDQDLYRKPFNIWNMARHGYVSNQTDAEVHGNRETGTRQVAVLDAFCMAVNVQWMKNQHVTADGHMYRGWPTRHLTHHCLDLWLACEAARDGKEIYMTGVSCTHHGGGSSTGHSYANARWLQGGSRAEDHLLPHIWLYSEYADVLPISTL